MSSLWSVVDELAGEDLDGVPDRQLEDDLVEISVQVRRLMAQRERRLGEIDRRGSFEDDGFLSTTAWLRARIGVGIREAARQTHRARSLSRMPLVAQTYQAGELTTGVVDVLAKLGVGTVRVGKRAGLVAHQK